jgi:oligopeptidase B
MKQLFLLCTLSLIACTPNSQFRAPQVGPQKINSGTIEKPVADRIPSTKIIHGETVVDEYDWMKDVSRSTPKVISHLEKENAYTEAVMEPTTTLQNKMVSETIAKMKLNDFTFPEKIAPYLYYYKNLEDKDYPLFVRRLDIEGSKEELLLDVNELAKGHDFYSLQAARPSPNHQYLAFAVDLTGAEKYTIFFKDLVNGTTLETTVKDVAPGFLWANDSKTLFYPTYDATYRVDKIWSHKVSTEQSQDRLRYEEKDNAYDIYLRKSKSQKYLFVEIDSVDSSEFRYLDLNQPESELKVFEPRSPNHRYKVYHGEGSFFILTDQDAVNFQIKKTLEGQTERAAWKTFIPPLSDKMLGERWAYNTIQEFQGYLVVFGRRAGTQTLDFHDLKTGESWSQTFDEAFYSIAPEANSNFTSTRLRFTYSSFVTPKRLYEYDLVKKELTLIQQNEVKGDFQPLLYETKKLFIPARDGALIPAFIIYRKDKIKEGGNPLFQYGYGAYGLNESAEFDYQLFSLLDRGVIYAIVEPRGSSAMGRQWYLDGRVLKKKNTIYDFIDATEYFIKEGYTTKTNVAAHGLSAGGILMGGIANERPELYQAIIAEVPFVDVINTMLDPTLRFTTYEYGEWGNPADKPVYDYMKTYSPYESVKEQAYPHMLLLAGLHDTRVNYWEPAKFAARLRYFNKGSSDILLQVLGAGHGGGTGRTTEIQETAFKHAFVLSKLGILE